MNTLTVELVPIDSLHPDPANPRRINDEELESLTRSLRQWGFVQPVLARREDSVVIGGHQRLVAARRVGLTEVPVIRLDISQEQARLLNLALNRISGTWDEQLLARLLADLGSLPDLDLSLSGFGDDEISELLRKLAAAEKADRPEDFDVEEALREAGAEPRTQPGDLWLLGEHRPLCGDATSKDDVTRLLDGAKPALMVTDPPYGVGYDPSWRNEVADGRGVVSSRRLGKVANDDRPTGRRRACCHRPGRLRVARRVACGHGVIEPGGCRLRDPLLAHLGQAEDGVRTRLVSLAPRALLVCRQGRSDSGLGGG